MQDNIVIHNECSRDKIVDSYLPILEDAIAAYHTVFGDSIIDIRLSGSVARGEATVGHSDIDFIAILQEKPIELQIDAITNWEQQLKRKYPVVLKVDLEAIGVDEVNDFRHFVFTTDSISIFGRDLYTQKNYVIDRRELSQIVTPDFQSIVHSYRYAIEGADEANEPLLFLYSRLIGKDILKCWRYTVLMQGGEYERNIHRIYSQLLHYVPEHKAIVHDLHELYAQPSVSKQRLLKVLSDAQTAKL